MNDLEGVSPPPTLADPFFEEVAARRQARQAILDFQRGAELGSHAQEAQALARLEGIEIQAREDSRAAGISRCALVLPPISELTG